ncbi:MAG: DNA primase [Phycisphaerales bacterium]
MREASDIVDVVGDVVRLKPKGREFIGVCPFHDDHSPSMYVVPAKQIFHCFSCGAGGDVFTFVQRYHGLEFGDALKLLAERAGIELRPRQERLRATPGEPTRADLLEASRAANDYFRAILSHAEHGRKAREVIAKRGISDEMVKVFELGAAADRWDGLEQTIEKKGLNRRAFVELGLLKRRDSGGEYDGFRNRLIFPIHQPQTGKAIAFGARKIDEADEPKYLNSPESELFDKSRNLYGLHQAARSIQKQGVAVVVEGYTDVIACHQAGVTNVVGTLGTALTPGHATLLKRLCPAVVLLFDGDEAGQRAADRAFEVLFAEPLDLKIACLSGATDAKDPDELLKREDGREVFGQILGAAPDLMTWHFVRLRERLSGAGVAARARAITDEMERLVSLGLTRLDPVRRRLTIRQIAEAAGVDERTIQDAMPAGRRSRAEASSEVEAKSARTPTAREAALGCLLCDGSLWVTLDSGQRDVLRTDAYRSPMTRVVADAAHRLAVDGVEPELSAVLDEIAAEAEEMGDPALALDAQAWATTLRQHAWASSTGSDEKLSELLADCVRRAAIDDALAGHADEGDVPEAREGERIETLNERMERLRDVQQRYGMNPRARLGRGGASGRV